MKRLITVLVGLMFFSNVVNAQGIEFIHNLDSALVIAKETNRIIFIDFFTSWCGPCKVMSKDVFPSEKVGNFYNSNFINCKIQCDDKGKGVETGKKFQIIAYPTLMFIDKDERIIHAVAGSLSIDGFIELGRLALNPDKNLLSITNAWDQGNRDTAFVKKYFNALNNAYLRQKAKDDFEKYFKGLTVSEKTGKSTFSLFKIVKPDQNSGAFEYVENNRKKYYKTIGRNLVDRYIRDVYFSLMSKYIYGEKDKDYKLEMEKFKSKNYPFYDELFMYIGVYARDSKGNPDVKEYIKRATEFLNKYGEKEDSYTLSLVSMFGNFTGRPNAGAEGIQWMENLLSRNRNPGYLSTYFYILWRNFQFDKALEVGHEMRENAIKDNKPTESIDQQIEMVNGLKSKQQKTR